MSRGVVAAFVVLPAAGGRVRPLRITAVLGVLSLAPAALPVPLPGGLSDAEARQLPPISIDAGMSREVLTGGFTNWEAYWVRLTMHLTASSSVYGGYRQTVRFGTHDRQFEGGGTVSLYRRLRVQFDASQSSTHRVVPIRGANLLVHHRVTDAWGIVAGGGRQVWDQERVEVRRVGLDRYVGSFRVGYHPSRTRLVEAGSTGYHHTLSGGWTYSQPSTVTLALGAGRGVVVNAFADLRFVTMYSAGLSGSHQLDPRHALSYRFAVQREDNAYTRRVLSLGVRRRL